MPNLGYYERGTCYRCREAKDRSEFYPNRSTGGLQSMCKACVSADGGERYKKKREQVLARNQAWRTRNPEKTREIGRNSHARNAAKRHENNKEWRQGNRAYDAFRSSTRRAARKQATPKWANSFFIEEAYRLAALRTAATGIEWHVDHIVPLQSRLVCGLHCEQNLAVRTAVENYAKGNRWWPAMPEASHA
jgi:hypothetical protein